MAEIDYSKLKQKFETEEEAIEFLRKYVESIRLTYIPLDKSLDMKNPAIAGVSFSILLGEVEWHTNDIRIAADKYIGYDLLKYKEWQAKNNTNNL